MRHPLKFISKENWSKDFEFKGHLRVRVASVLIATLTLILGVVLGADLLVVELKSSEILASLGELALLHALADVPVDEGALGVHQVELVVQPDSLGINLHKLDFLI